MGAHKNSFKNTLLKKELSGYDCFMKHIYLFCQKRIFNWFWKKKALWKLIGTFP